MANRKNTKGQTTIYKTHNELEIEYHEPHKAIDFSFNLFYAFPLEQGDFRIFYQHKM